MTWVLLSFQSAEHGPLCPFPSFAETFLESSPMKIFRDKTAKWQKRRNNKMKNEQKKEKTLFWFVPCDLLIFFLWSFCFSNFFAYFCTNFQIMLLATKKSENSLKRFTKKLNDLQIDAKNPTSVASSFFEISSFESKFLCGNLWLREISLTTSLIWL